MKTILRKSAISILLISSLIATITSLTRSDQKFLQSDMVAYKAASHVFFSDGNPYLSEQVFAFEKQMGFKGENAFMIWNPPIIFALFGPIFILPMPLMTIVWQSLEIISGFFLILLGWKYSTGTKSIFSNLSSSEVCLYCSFLLFLSFPFICELQFIQIALVLSALMFLGIFLYFKEHFFISGFLLSSALIKPHILFLPILLMGFWVLKERRYKFMLGTLLGLVFLFMIAELINPNVIHNWLFRSEWPSDQLGSSLTSLIYSALLVNQLPTPFFIRLILPIVTTAIFICWQKKRLMNSNIHSLLCAVAFSPFVTPYGFIFDQVILLPIVGYIAGLSFNHSQTTGFRTILLLSLASILTFLASKIEIFTLPISWFVYPLIIFLFFLLTNNNQLINYIQKYK